MCKIRIKMGGDKQSRDKHVGFVLQGLAKKHFTDKCNHCLLKDECFKIWVVSASKYLWGSLLQVKCREGFQAHTYEIRLKLTYYPVHSFLLHCLPHPLKWLRTTTLELTRARPWCRCRHCSAPFVSEGVHPSQPSSMPLFQPHTPLPISSCDLPSSFFFSAF